MNLIKRFPYANLYDLGGENRQSVFGGIPNVSKDVNNNLTPLDNELDVTTTHPTVKYIIKQGPMWVGFHNKNTNKFLVGIKARTGEQFTKTLMNAPESAPAVSDKRMIQWNYPGGSWIREYLTEKHIKEVMRQKAGQAVKFRIDLQGLTPKIENQGVSLYRSNGKLGLRIPRPCYINAQGDPQGYFSIDWQKVGDHWEITYPTPSTDKLVDPTIEFSDRAGGTGGDHKDTCLDATNTDRSYATATAFHIRSAVYYAILRYSLTGHIPQNAIINSALLNLYCSAYTAVNQVVYAHRLVTPWGVTPTDEGTSGDPPAGEEATFRDSFELSNTRWGGGGNFAVANDSVAAEVSTTITAVNTWFTWAIPIMVQNWVANNITNHGILFNATAIAAHNSFASQNNAVAANRSYLTIGYRVASCAAFMVPVLEDIPVIDD